MTRFRRSWIHWVVAPLAICGVAQGSDVDYLRDVKPLLREKCAACHGPLAQKGGLRLDAGNLIRKGGDSGAAIDETTPDESELLFRVTAEDTEGRMPPPAEGERLTASEVAVLRGWIRLGAKSPTDEDVLDDPFDHWAFQPPRKAAIPQAISLEWSNNPIDAFIAKEQGQNGLMPAATACRETLLRRVYLDLVGLPPTLEELTDFLQDKSPDAYEKVVDRLLDSPQYGERWGRHWMDIWRYSDWYGFKAEVRNSQKHIWHWRDWIVESLNGDKGYDQMLREMLAADELYPNDFNRMRATGFLARQYFLFNRTTWLDDTIGHTAKAMLGLTVNCAKCHDHKYDPFTQREYYQLRAVFEPYHVRLEMAPGESDFDKNGIPRAYDEHLDTPTYLHVRGDDRNPDKTRVIEPALPACLAGDDRALDIEPVELPPDAGQPGLRPFVVDAYRSSGRLAIAQAHRELGEAIEQLVAAESAPPGRQKAAEVALIVADDVSPKSTAAEPHETQAANSATSNRVEEMRLAATLAEKKLATAQVNLASIEARAAADRALSQKPAAGNAESLRAEAVRAEQAASMAEAEEAVGRAELSLLRAGAANREAAEKVLADARASLEKARQNPAGADAKYTPLTGALKARESYLDRKPEHTFPARSTGRRTAFARWLTNPGNALTARVAVNHIWMRHMGKPLVPTVYDFGLNGTPPTHPELLDWLAVELVERNWSMKHIHRLITKSRTYRLSSSAADTNGATLKSDPENRYYWRRDPVRMEAEVIRDSLLRLAGELDPSFGGPSVPVEQSSTRRSLYYVHSGDEREKFLSVFDSASIIECYRRADSIVPQQALALENSPLVTAMAEKIAARVAAGSPSANSSEFVRRAFLTILACEPSAAEQALVEQMIPRLETAARAAGHQDFRLRARVAVVQALLNHNDFVTLR